MAHVVVDVMPKPEILDPQGQAIAEALPTLGVHSVSGVRQGKRFELVVDGAIDDAKLKELNQIAATLLSNPVIEDFTLRVVETAEVGG